MTEKVDGANPAKSIYEYTDYRAFLKDRVDYLQKLDKTLTYRALSKKAGLKSPSFIIYLIKGERNLTAESAKKIGSAINLTKEENSYFVNLAMLNQATSAEDKQLYAKRILRSGPFQRAYPLAQAQLDYYSHWYYVAIRELVALPTFIENTRWIAKIFENRITPQEAAKAIESLLALNLLTREPNGKLKQVTADVETPNETLMAIARPIIRKYQQTMMVFGSEAVDKYTIDQRSISSVTFSVSKESYNKIKEMVEDFRKEVVEVVSGQESLASSVCQLNIQLFPLISTTEKVDEK